MKRVDLRGRHGVFFMEYFSMEKINHTKPSLKIFDDDQTSSLFFAVLPRRYLMLSSSSSPIAAVIPRTYYQGGLQMGGQGVSFFPNQLNWLKQPLVRSFHVDNSKFPQPFHFIIFFSLSLSLRHTMIAAPVIFRASEGG